MNLIPIGDSGQCAIVDDLDHRRFAKLKWGWGSGGRYAQCTTYQNPSYRSMHVMVAGRKPGMDVDHINGNRLDNRRCNLRHVSRRENLRNMKGRVIGPKLPTGVQFMRAKNRRRPFRSRITVGGAILVVGYYATPLEASDAYIKKSLELFPDCRTF